MRYVVGREGKLALYWLVDESDGVIADAKLQSFRPVGLIAAAEIGSELVLRKNLDQVSRLTAELLDQRVPDEKRDASFPKECDAQLNQVVSAMDKAIHNVTTSPLPLPTIQPPLRATLAKSRRHPGWIEFPHGQKVKIIEEVIDKEIRPYIELDAGGVKLMTVHETGEVVIAYEGSCTTCHSSTGSTLTAIQKILKSRVHPSLFVTPQ